MRRVFSGTIFLFLFSHFRHLVVLFVNTVTHQDDRGARSARRGTRAYQAYASAEQHSASGYAAAIKCYRIDE
jgi:hypothetical protein